VNLHISSFRADVLAFRTFIAPRQNSSKDTDNIDKSELKH
jgi:hypothetical protein